MDAHDVHVYVPLVIQAREVYDTYVHVEHPAMIPASPGGAMADTIEWRRLAYGGTTSR